MILKVFETYSQRLLACLLHATSPHLSKGSSAHLFSGKVITPHRCIMKYQIQAFIVPGQGFQSSALYKYVASFGLTPHIHVCCVGIII